MKCIWCREREATQDDMYCSQCDYDLEAWDKACIENTFMASRWRLAKAVEELKHAVKASFPQWLRRLL